MSDFTLESFGSIAALPASAQALLDSAGRSHLFLSRPWLESFVAAGLAADAEPLLFVLTDSAGQACALLPCQRLRRGEGPGHPSVASLTSFYSCDFRPLIASDRNAAEIASALGRAVAQTLRSEAVVRFDSLDSTLPVLDPFLRGLSRPGRATLRYAHFGRWWGDLAGLNFDTYMAERNGALREVVRRKGKALEKAGATFEIFDGDIEKGIADYEEIYAQSWKEPEPFPEFQPVLMRALAKVGWLRLAICRIEGRPIAAQLWTVVNRRATVLKLAHERASDRLSPGTLLTAFAIRTLMERDGVTALDFGRGDDGYKRAWAANRTPHIGILWTSIARRPLMAARHGIGQLLRGGEGARDSDEAAKPR